MIAMLPLTASFLILGFLIVWEAWVPMRTQGILRQQRYFFHGALFLINSVLSYFLFRGVLFGLAVTASENGWGVLSSVPLPWVVKMSVCVLFLDFGGYCIHRLLHSIPLFWYFHQVHHQDNEVDVSTAFREHFGQTIITTILEAVFILCMGIPPECFVLYSSLLFFSVHFHHGNIRIPEKIDRALSLFWITPSFHLLHHIRGLEDSNFGGIFPFWDKLFNTFENGLIKRSEKIGILNPKYLFSLRWVFFPVFGATTRALAGSCSSPLPLDILEESNRYYSIGLGVLILIAVLVMYSISKRRK